MIVDLDSWEKQLVLYYGLCKEVQDNEFKQYISQSNSLDCTDQMEDDDDQKAAGCFGKRHLSKNLVAERKRRKKLNERLYALRALDLNANITS